MRSPGRVLASPRVAIARRLLSSLTREKTIVLAVLVQLFVAAFSSFLVVGLVSLYQPDSIQGGQVAVGISGDRADVLERAADRRDDVSVRSYRTREAAMDAFVAGEVDAVVSANAEGGRILAEVTAPRSGVRTTLVVRTVRELLETVERIERDGRRRHVEREVVPLPPDVPANPYFGFAYTVLVPLLLFLPPFISGSIAVDAITEEIERGTLELLRVAPVSLVGIVDGTALTPVLLAPVQALLWMLLLGANGIAVANLPALLAIVTAITAAVVTLGLVLGTFLGRRRDAQLLYSILVLVGFGVAALLPEHPSTTVAKLAIDSATAVTFAHVLGYVLFALVAVAVGRRFVGRIDPETV